MKAGLMEIADLFIVNKADRPGADRLRHEVEVMLGLRLGVSYRDIPAHHGVTLGTPRNPARAARRAAAEDASLWTPPVVSTVAEAGIGVDDVVAALDRHFDYLETSGALHRRRRDRLREQVVDIVERHVRQRLWCDPQTNAWLSAELPALEDGTVTPFAVADALLARSAARLATPAGTTHEDQA
jgi:LAO/AO transport system kinase